MMSRTNFRRHLFRRDIDIRGECPIGKQLAPLQSIRREKIDAGSESNDIKSGHDRAE